MVQSHNCHKRTEILQGISWLLAAMKEQNGAAG